MRTLAALAVIPLLAGCAAHQMPEASASQAAREASVPCYRLDSGVEVSTQVGRCPARQEVEGEVTSFLARMGAPAGSFDGARLVFVPYWMECSGVMTWGCSRGRTMLINLAGEGAGRLTRPTGAEFPEEVSWERSYDWRGTLAHEMGHVLRAEAGLPSDGTHADHWWWAVAENRSRSTPAFKANDSRAIAIHSIAIGREHGGRLASN